MKKFLIIILVIILIAALGLGVFLFVKGKNKTETQDIFPYEVEEKENTLKISIEGKFKKDAWELYSDEEDVISCEAIENKRHKAVFSVKAKEDYVGALKFNFILKDKKSKYYGYYIEIQAFANTDGELKIAYSEEMQGNLQSFSGKSEEYEYQIDVINNKALVKLTSKNPCVWVYESSAMVEEISKEELVSNYAIYCYSSANELVRFCAEELSTALEFSLSADENAILKISEVKTPQYSYIAPDPQQLLEEEMLSKYGEKAFLPGYSCENISEFTSYTKDYSSMYSYVSSKVTINEHNWQYKMASGVNAKEFSIGSLEELNIDGKKVYFSKNENSIALIYANEDTLCSLTRNLNYVDYAVFETVNQKELEEIAKLLIAAMEN